MLEGDEGDVNDNTNTSADDNSGVDDNIVDGPFGGGDGDDSTNDGDNTDGDNTDGDNTDGDNSDGDNTDGDGSEGAPEAYADFQFPEGIEPDTQLLEKFTPMAKELGLSQEAAQEVLNLHTEALTKATSPEHIADAVLKAQESITQTRSDEWAKALKADAEIGGVNLDATQKMANQAIVRFGDNALVADLKEHGFLTNPSLLRMLNKVGAAIAEDSMGNSQTAHGDGKGELSQAQKMYPEFAKEA